MIVIFRETFPLKVPFVFTSRRYVTGEGDAFTQRISMVETLFPVEPDEMNETKYSGQVKQDGDLLKKHLVDLLLL